MSDSIEGTRLGAYRIERLLGEGAMGEVYLAIHEALSRPVAIKTLKPQVAADRALTERFFSEARAVNIIRHENIVECTDLVNEPNGRSYIVMELLEGKTLGGAIREVGKMAPQRAVKIGAQIADALSAAHAKGIVHRDLKPDNVFLIRRAGSADYVKVLDFGMARLKPELGGVVSTQSGALIGTPAYMSPEQARGEKVGPAADIYALGVVLFHMLTGQLPFAATSLTLMLIAVVQEAPPSVDKVAADVPEALVKLVARALAKEPGERPADMATFRTELFEAVGLPVPPTVPHVEKAAGSDLGMLATVDPNSVAPLDKTTAPPWAGQTSRSAAAAEVLPAPTKEPAADNRGGPWKWIGAAGAAFALATGAYFMFSGGSGGTGASTAPAAAPGPAPAAAPTATPTPAPTPAPAPATAPAPVPAPTPADVGSDRAPTHHAATSQRPRTTPSTRPNVPATGSGSAAPPPPPPTPDAKTDRTKSLVAPKPQ